MDRFDEMRGKQGTGSGGGGAVIIPPEAGALTGIRFENHPIIVDYNEGDSIDIKGMKVIGIFENNVYVDVTSACEIVVDDPLTVYTNTVIVRYGGFELTYSIKVYSSPLEIPSGTKVLAHFNSNLTNAINGSALSTSGATYTSGKFGNALASNMTIDSAVATHGMPSPGTLAGGKGTIEFWFYRRGSSDYNKTLIEYGTPYENGVFIWINASYVGIRVVGNADTSTRAMFSSTVQSNAWHHYAFTFNNGTECSLTRRVGFLFDAETQNMVEFDIYLYELLIFR